MKKFIDYIALALVGAFATTGCEHPNTEESLPYYFKEPIAYLEKVDKSFDILHTPEGAMSQSVKMPFEMGVSKPVGVDLTLNLEIEVKGKDLTKENIEFLSGSSVTIPAGKKSVSNELSIKSWNFADNNRHEENYELAVRIKSIYPTSVALIASETNHVVYRINKRAFSNTIPGKKPSGEKISNEKRQTWEIKTSQDPAGDEWKIDENNALVDGGLLMKYIESKGEYLGIEIDIKETQTLTGLYGTFLKKNINWPVKSSIETSENGQDWTEQMGQRDVPQNRYLHIAFTVPIKARYIRWKLWGPKNVCMDEAYVYIQK